MKCNEVTSSDPCRQCDKIVSVINDYALDSERLRGLPSDQQKARNLGHRERGNPRRSLAHRQRPRQFGGAGSGGQNQSRSGARAAAKRRSQLPRRALRCAHRGRIPVSAAAAGASLEWDTRRDTAWRQLSPSPVGGFAVRTPDGRGRAGRAHLDAKRTGRSVRTPKARAGPVGKLSGPQHMDGRG